MTNAPDGYQRRGRFRILVTMRHAGTATGERAQLVEQLRSAATGWEHYGKHELAAAAEHGATELESGATSVRVGHVEYTVTE